MSIRIECPECQAAFRVEESMSGKTVRCKECGEPFRAKPTPKTDETIQSTPTRSGPARSKPANRSASSGRTAPEPRSSSLLPVLLIVGGAGLMLFLGLASVAAYYFLGSDSEQPAPAQPVALANVDQGPAVRVANAAPPEAPPPNVAPVAPLVVARVPDAPAGDGTETVVDLPARGEDLPEIAGVNFGPSDKAPAPRPNPPGPRKPSVKLTDDPLPAQPPEKWYLYIQPTRAYALWLPKAERKLFQREETKKVGDDNVRYTVLQCDITNNVQVNVLALRLPVKAGEQLDALTVIEIFRDLYLKEDAGAVTDEFDIVVGRMAGKEYRIDRNNGEMTRLRLVLVGSVVYQLSVTGTKEQVEGEAAKLVLGSFKHERMVNGMLNKQGPANKKP